MKLVYQNTISRLYEKIIGNLSNVHTQDLNDFIYSAQMKGLHQFHIILQSTYMKFSYTLHIPSYTLQQCIDVPDKMGCTLLGTYRCAKPNFNGKYTTCFGLSHSKSQ